MLFSGRTIIVTGGARGVGRAIALDLAARDAHIVIGDIDDAGAKVVAAEIILAGGSARALKVDLGDEVSITRFAADIADHEGMIEGLVNNGAIATNVGGMRFEDIETELWDRVHRVNVRGTWLITKALSPLLRDGAGRIVNMASDTALWGPPRLLAYVASKGAVISMTRSLARELGERRIGVVALAPGIMRNEATDYVPAERHQENETRRAIPGPQFPEDILEVVAFSLSAGALPLTGQVIPTNAGFWFA